MPLANRIGPHTIAKYDHAIDHRLREAAILSATGHWRSAIYLYEYAVEMMLGCKYFAKILGFGPDREISDGKLKQVLKQARNLSTMEDKSHPIDGWSSLLIGRKIDPAFERSISDKIITDAGFVADNWRPTLRYRAIEVLEAELEVVRSAAEWLHVRRTLSRGS